MNWTMEPFLRKVIKISLPPPQKLLLYIYTYAYHCRETMCESLHSVFPLHMNDLKVKTKLTSMRL